MTLRHKTLNLYKKSGNCLKIKTKIIQLFKKYTLFFPPCYLSRLQKISFRI